MRVLIITLIILIFTIPVQAQEATLIYHNYPVFRFPDEQSPIVSLMPQYTPVTLLGRYKNDWIRIRARDGLWEGWLPVSTLETAYDLNTLPVETIDPLDILYNLSFWNFTSAMHSTFLRGAEMGNRPDVFSKVGDSITVNTAFLQPFARGIHRLGEDYAYLETALDFYNVDEGHPTTSFLERSRAAKVGWRSSDVLAWDDFYLCERGDTRLACEYRITRPASALIMLGTNDVHVLSVQQYDANMRRIVEISLQWGVIPVLSTIPPQRNQDEKVLAYNLALVQIADDYDVPLWNYWLAMENLPNRGLSYDGVHPSTPPTFGTAIFTPDNLQYGFTVRNLMALQVLHLLLYEVMYI
jgi:hypothetical protein